jgi:hypothetical protein
MSRVKSLLISAMSGLALTALATSAFAGAVQKQEVNMSAIVIFPNGEPLRNLGKFTLADAELMRGIKPIVTSHHG